MPCNFVAGEVVANLRAIAMHNGDPPALRCQTNHRSKAFACMAKLLRDRPRPGRGSDCVAADRDDDGARQHLPKLLRPRR